MKTKRYSNKNELLLSIHRLERSTKQQEDHIYSKWQSTVKSVKPTNLIKQLIQDVKKTSKPQSGILLFVTDVISKYTTQKVLVSKNSSIFKRLLAYGLQNQLAKYLFNYIKTK